MESSQIRKITGIGILLGIEIVLQVVGNFISFPGGVSINLSLVPIALGCILYGPLAGGFLGLMNGLLVLFAPSTEIFLTYAPVGTVITCLSKCTIAGIVAGLVFKAIGKKNYLLGAIICSLLIPIINTGIFALCALTLVKNAIVNIEGYNGKLVSFVLLIVITWNFLLEITITAVLSPAIVKITKIIKKEKE